MSPAASAQLAQAGHMTSMNNLQQMAQMAQQQGGAGQSWLPAMTQINMPAGAGPMTMMGAQLGQAPMMAAQTQVVVSKHSMPEDVDPRLIMVREPDSPRAAAFRVLRHRLVERGDPRTICVTSAEPGEGKTTCAINLAMSLGECGRARVLLMEANFRNPRLAPMLGFRPPECFSEQLTRHREQPLDPWSVVEVFWPWLHVAAVDPKIGGKPLLDAPAFEIAVARLRPGYDYLVIDSPPILGSADVNLIEDAVDAVLLACWARRSRGRSLTKAIEQLSPAKVIGVTLLDV
jgi:Mrp family chromosome partitioning ATPase